MLLKLTAFREPELIGSGAASSALFKSLMGSFGLVVESDFFSVASLRYLCKKASAKSCDFTS